ncbi:hypothetical protein OO382_002668 [Listeria monocytogenes]|nr:hypothetical protein [Listeria monocytogenes]
MKDGFLFHHERKLSNSEAFFYDLHLLDIFQRITTLSMTDIQFYLYSPAGSISEINQRQDVFKDLLYQDNYEVLNSFYKNIGIVKKELTEIKKKKSNVDYYNINFFHVICKYIKFIKKFQADMSAISFRSDRLIKFQDDLLKYCLGESFKNFENKTQEIYKQFIELNYGVLIDGRTVSVIEEHDTTREDYSIIIEDVFSEFIEIEEDYPLKLPKSYGMLDSFQEMILKQVTSLYSELFDNLSDFVSDYQQFIPKDFITVFQELGFYLAYIQLTKPLLFSNDFTFPNIVSDNKEVNEILKGKDLSLILQSNDYGKLIVPNDFDFSKDNYLAVVTGPNQGGKTTFARMIGQIYYLSLLGMMVPAESVQISLIDKIFTHFERGENVDLEVGKLKDDVLRIHDITSNISSKSLVIANELFSSTTKIDAEELAKKVITLIKKKGARLIYITFLESISSSEDAVSYVSLVDSNDPDKRLFKIRKQKSNNRAYTQSLVKKYRISYKDILERLNHEV